jgi:hypothetical protein
MKSLKLNSCYAVASAAVIGIAACSTAGDMGPLSPTSARFVQTTASVGDVGDNTPNQGEVEICKYGTDATFNVGPTGGTSAEVQIAAGTCKVVVVDLSTGNTANSYTISEKADPSYTLQSVQRTDIQFVPNTTTDAPLTGPASTTDPVVALVNAYHGTHLVYHNNPVVEEGCSYTQGWYKNPKHVWPAGDLQRGTSFDGGASAINILNTPPKGNVYYILAHQYITALLNVQGGASSTDITQELADAAAYFAAATVANPLPAGWTKEEVTALAGALDDYNNGLTGPGHCDDEVLVVE